MTLQNETSLIFFSYSIRALISLSLYKVELLKFFDGATNTRIKYELKNSYGKRQQTYVQMIIGKTEGRMNDWRTVNNRKRKRKNKRNNQAGTPIARRIEHWRKILMTFAEICDEKEPKKQQQQQQKWKKN